MIEEGHTTLLTPGKEWSLGADLGKQLQFRREILETSMRPNLVMWSAACKTVLIVELTVPWEGGLKAAHEWKQAKCSHLAAECREVGWRAVTYPVEVRCRGFVGSLTSRLLCNTGATWARRLEIYRGQCLVVAEKEGKVWWSRQHLKHQQGGGRERSLPSLRHQETSWG